MSLLKPGELREILERELPGVLDTTDYVNPYGNVKPTEQLQVVDEAADTMGATDPAPVTGDAAAARQPEVINKEDPAAPELSEDDAVVHAEHLPTVMRFMRDALGYQYLSHITPVDYPAYDIIEVIYHLFRVDGGPGQIIRVRVPRDNPVIPSITPFWPGGNLQERVCWDLYGVRFPGHPYHKRIYMWEEFEGHPMRKDFQKIGDSYYHFHWKGEGGGEE
jgi:NADH-quinone oxidoreductase subunit C